MKEYDNRDRILFLPTTLIVSMLCLNGCQLLGMGEEGAYIKYTRECTVEVVSGAKVEGIDDFGVLEAVEIDGQCNAVITRDEDIN